MIVNCSRAASIPLTSSGVLRRPGKLSPTELEQSQQGCRRVLGTFLMGGAPKHEHETMACVYINANRTVKDFAGCVELCAFREAISSRTWALCWAARSILAQSLRITLLSLRVR